MFMKRALDSYACVSGKFGLSGKKKEKNRGKLVPDNFALGAVVWEVEVIDLHIIYIYKIHWNRLTHNWYIQNTLKYDITINMQELKTFDNW